MSDWLTVAAEQVAAGAPLALITLAGAEGSAPREAGAKMLVGSADQWGTIGGGALEYAAISRARALLEEGAGTVRFEDFTLGPELGQCCGGRVRLAYERLGPDDLDWINLMIGRVADGRTATVERRIDGRSRCVRDRAPASFRFIDERGALLDSALPPIGACAGFVDAVFGVRVPIYVYGAGHVGTAVVDLLAAQPARVFWIDRRADRLSSRGRDISPIRTDRETEIARGAPAGSCHLVMTHDHQLDYDLVLTVLTEGKAAYCGLIGSATKRARFERRLLRAGLTPASIDRLTCPIGANGLKSKAPEAIALSAVHEMLLAHEALRSRAWK